MTTTVCGSCGASVGDGASLCTGCTRDLAGLLLQAASIAPDLDDAVARLLKRGSGGRRSGDENPLPVNLYASKARGNLGTALARWTFAVLDTRPDLFGLWPPKSIGGTARWLTARLAVLRQVQDAAGLLAELRDAVRDALAVVDRKPERAPAGLCDNCGRQLLAELGADSVTCACGMTLTGVRAARQARAEAANFLGTAQEVSDMMRALGKPVPRGTITSWASRGRLLPRPGGVYALSDVLALHAQSQARVRG